MEKDSKKCAQLQRIMPNVGGPNYCERRFLCGVIHSIVLHAAPAWREAVKIKRNCDILLEARKKGLLRAATTYRTVSAE